MQKRQLYHSWTKLPIFKPRYLLIVTLLFSLVTISALRANNEHMVRLRSAVYSADKNSGNVTQALQHLQAYVTTHMNTSLTTGNTAVYPPIQLQYTYQRLVAAQAAGLQTTNASLYTDAQAYCQALDPTDFSGHNRVPCIEQYVTTHGAQPLPTIPTGLYEFDFVSPRWSPDLAGWSLLISLLLAALTVAVFVFERIIKNEEHQV